MSYEMSKLDRIKFFMERREEERLKLEKKRYERVRASRGLDEKMRKLIEEGLSRVQERLKEMEERKRRKQLWRY